ncbi:AraC family transcriptional regulator [Paenibacillus sp. CC-CFT747]|nr:AraC family transcriptional regulator [Paenibacillus sp. CC-CFT747]
MKTIGSGPLEFEYRRTSRHEFKEVFHSHREAEFTYVHEGTGQLILEGKTYEIQADTLLVFRPFQLHRIQVDVGPDRPFIRTPVIFAPGLLKPYLAVFPLLKTAFQKITETGYRSDPVYRLKPGNPLPELLSRFSQSGEPSSGEMNESYILFLLNFLKEVTRMPGIPSPEIRIHSDHHDRAEEAMKWVEAHHQEPVRLERMAKALHMSPYHLSHFFKRATGTTVMAYLQATRIKHACMLLMQTALSIPEIGARVGLPNSSHFCKVFKNEMSISPHQYRLKFQNR